MITEIKLPKLSRDMQDGDIVGFRVEVGDEVKNGDCLFELETDKACVEVESPADGFVKYILAKAGLVLEVGTTIMILADKDEDIPKDLIDSLTAKIPVQQASETLEAKPAEQTSVAEAIRKDEAAAVKREIKLGNTVQLTKLQKITAERMLESKSQIPCFYLNVRVDVTELVDLRAALNQDSKINISYNDFIIKGVGAGLEHFPIMTGTLIDGFIKLADDINIGLAVSVSAGLVVPVIKDVNKKSIAEIARDRVALIEKAEKNRLSPADLEGACITISNLGAFGVDCFIPITVPGQCSIIGVGQINEEPVPADDGFIIRKLMSLTISVDHRIANGAYGSEFLDFARKYLEDISNFRG